MMWWSQQGMDGGQWVGMALAMIVSWSVPVALAVWLFRRHPSPHLGVGSTPSQGRAHDLLAERFARGDIDEAQFTRGRVLLRDEGTQLPWRDGRYARREGLLPPLRSDGSRRTRPPGSGSAGRA